MSNKIKIKRSNVPGKVPTLAQLEAGELALNTADSKFYYSTGTEIIEVANKDAVLLLSGGALTDSLSLPKTAGKGLLVDNTYSYIDIIGDIAPKTQGTGAAVFDNFIGNVGGWTHTAVSYGHLLYHIPHDYAPNTDLHIHIHWGHNGTNISGNFIVNFYASYAKRTYPASAFVTPVPLTLTSESLNMTNSVRYCHRVDEILLSTSGGGLNLLNTDNIEVDGLVALRYSIDTIPSITGSDVSNLPYIFEIDLHMQSTGVGTKNKDPNYYA